MFSYLRHILSGLATLVCTAIAFIPFFMGTNTYSEFIKKINLTNGQFALVCFLIFVVIIAYSIIIYVRNNKKIEQTGKVFGDFHRKMLETVFELRKNSDNYSVHTTVDEFYTKIQAPCYELCEFIAKFLENKYRKEFSVCIKTIDEKSLRKVKKTGNLGEAQVFTLCRAGRGNKERSGREESQAKNTKQKRFLIDVGSNYDFLTILDANKNNSVEEDLQISNQASAFACRNLLIHDILLRIINWKFPNQPKYTNSTEDYWKYYLSTVVVPIRIATEYITTRSKSPIAGQYQVVGFLCVDYRGPVSKAVLNELAGYMKGFGDSFYELFHEIGIIDRKIAKAEKNILKKGG